MPKYHHLTDSKLQSKLESLDDRSEAFHVLVENKEIKSEFRAYYGFSGIDFYFVAGDIDGKQRIRYYSYG